MRPMRAAYDDAARRQLGLLTTSQLTELGWTDGEIRESIKRKEFVRMRPGVVRCAGAPLTQDVAWLAAQLAAGDDHLLSHLTAVAIWGYRNYPEPTKIDLLTTEEGRCQLEGVRGHRTGSLPDDQRTTRRKLPVTSPARTLVDTCGTVPFSTFRSAMNHSLRKHAMRPVDFVRCVDQAPLRGRCTTRPARLLVASLVPGYDPGESDRELDIVETLVAGGYPRPQQQIWVRERRWKYRIDVGYADRKHGFEYQSEQEHLNRESFHNDQLRTTRLQRAGWTIWPITSRTGRAELLLIAATIFGESSFRATPDQPKSDGGG